MRRMLIIADDEWRLTTVIACDKQGTFLDKLIRDGAGEEE